MCDKPLTGQQKSAADYDGCVGVIGFGNALGSGIVGAAETTPTLETLAEIKNPQPTAFIKQQNIAANQQVNNERADLPTSTRAGARARGKF